MDSKFLSSFLDDKEDSKSAAVVAELENIDDECDQKVKRNEIFCYQVINNVPSIDFLSR
jgi:hypothetical protein